MSRCLPDLQSVNVKDEGRFEAIVKLGVGPVKGNFKFHLTVLEKDPPRHARIKAQGSGSGSSIDLDATMNLESANGGTLMKWQAETKLAGLIATIGQRLISGTTERTVNEFFSCIKQKIEA
jgi:carbon monoxide dehydrogenase subunit G